MKIHVIIRKEPILFVAAVFSILSMFAVAPSMKYIEYIDFKTLICLFCLMISIKGLEREGLLEMFSAKITARLGTERAVAFFLVFSCFFASMLMTNDVALIALVPITITIMVLCGLERWGAFLIVLQTIAANVGSGLTPVGNPQNLFLFTYFKMNLPSFILTMLPVVLIGGVLLGLSCLFIPNEPLVSNIENRQIKLRPKFLTAYSAMFVLAVLAVFGIMSHYFVLGLLLVAALIIDRRTLMQVDYSLLLTFVAIFIFVGNLAAIPSISILLSSLIQKNVVLSAIITSQITSNVPAAVLLSRFTTESQALLVGVNVGGLGTLIASMASVISYKLYANTFKGQTMRYLKIFTLWNAVFLVVLAFVALI